MVAIFALLIQTLTAAAHISATAIRSSGTFAPDATLGFLEICTGNGIIRLVPGSHDHGSGHGSTCPVCVSVCALGFDQPTAIADVTPPIFNRGDALAWHTAYERFGLRRLSDGPARAPPSFKAIDIDA